MLGLGVGGLLVYPTAKLYGKRPLYLLSATTFLLYSMWCAVSSGYTSFSVARGFQGLAASPMEILVAITVFEISYLHQRGLWLGTYMLCSVGGMNLMPLISGVTMHFRTWN